MSTEKRERVSKLRKGQPKSTIIGKKNEYNKQILESLSRVEMIL